MGAVAAVALLGACGDDGGDASSTTTAATTTTEAPATTTARTTTTTAARTTTTEARTTTTSARTTTTTAARTTTTAARTTTSGGSPTSGPPTSADGPRFVSFDVLPNAPCDGENATVTMAYATTGVETIAVSVNGQPYEGGAGYGPNETSVVANFPCPPGSPPEATVRLQGCAGDGRCAESEDRSVTVQN